MELPNFTISSEDDLAMLQASKSNKSQRNQKQQISLCDFWGQSQVKDVF